MASVRDLTDGQEIRNTRPERECVEILRFWLVMVGDGWCCCGETGSHLFYLCVHI